MQQLLDTTEANSYCTFFGSVSYPMLRMTHPSLFSLCSVFLCMFVRLRVQGFEISVNKEFQKKKLVNSKT